MATNDAKPALMNGINQFLQPYCDWAEAALEQWLDQPAVPPPLLEAMRYVTLGGGKRLRPALVRLAAEAAAAPKAPPADPAPAAVAVEFVHCYSLVHDDLPAMDDDDLRRGRPTAHVKFGEAMAILTGDALLTRAFEVLARAYPSELGSRLSAELAGGAGPAGMIGGQVADMGLWRVPAGLEGVQYIHLRKTAALIRSAVRMGGICGGAGEEELEALGQYGERLGLAFQAFDDLLDATAGAETLGKTAGKDAGANKRTYAAQVGVEETARLALAITCEACQKLDGLGRRAAQLRQLALLLVGRDR